MRHCKIEMRKAVLPLFHNRLSCVKVWCCCVAQVSTPGLGCAGWCETTGSVDISTDLLERGQQSSEDNSNVAPPPSPPPTLPLYLS